MNVFLFMSVLSFSFASAYPLTLQEGPFDSGKIYLPCRFDLVDDLCFLDTGSTESIIANQKSFASTPTVGKIKYKSAANISMEIDQIVVKQIALGPMSVGPIKVGRVENPDASSVLGINFFATFPFSLNFSETPELKLFPDSSVLLKSELTVLEKNLLAVPVSVNHFKTLSLVDTGAGLSVMNIELVQNNSENFEFIQDIPHGVDATGSEVSLKLYKAKLIKIENLEFENEYVLGMNFDVVHTYVSQNIQFIIGFNLIKKANWHFDLQKKKWTVSSSK